MTATTPLKVEEPGKQQEVRVGKARSEQPTCAFLAVGGTQGRAAWRNHAEPAGQFRTPVMTGAHLAEPIISIARHNNVRLVIDVERATGNSCNNCRPPTRRSAWSASTSRTQVCRSTGSLTAGRINAGTTALALQLNRWSAESGPALVIAHGWLNRSWARFRPTGARSLSTVSSGNRDRPDRATGWMGERPLRCSAKVGP